MDVSDGQYIPLPKNDLRPLYPPMALIDRYFCDRNSLPRAGKETWHAAQSNAPRAPRGATLLLRIRLAGTPTPPVRVSPRGGQWSAVFKGEGVRVSLLLEQKKPLVRRSGNSRSPENASSWTLLILHCCNNLRPFSPCKPPDRAVRDAKSRTAPLPSRGAARDCALAVLHPERIRP